ncbi:Mvp1p NDAI_0C02730 [Naumovozyma dairenensis CBS 421]|uniref:Sorting nexin MVP1 n=1 Tax=Naumovozyma dairenensis (strain ATCC 10597 / BCRC 20456 / CBS 421 / NBRC 0211 / NRRL Y-12639) TaxID=1071378 RepID=G0W822_NAUDC|nr:hypothetical protein NDAI_0C02730 [Naumovozyma dairenensis CBS 421]CCD23933.1 hypothetical protein NDAI_0C02730 [Naumovozyma dairenensis CBS 421]
MNTYDEEEPDPWRSGPTTNAWSTTNPTITSNNTDRPDDSTSTRIASDLTKVSLIDRARSDLFNSSADVLEESIWNETLATQSNDSTTISAEATTTNQTFIPENILNQDTNKHIGNSMEDTNNVEEALNDWCDKIRKTYKPLDYDIIAIEEIPEREGLLFKHANYSVKHLVDLPHVDSPKDKSVIRRYSDFVWLQEILLRRYPFRMVPELPPKRIGSQNADPVFLLKRKNGLRRFINLVMKHPVFKNDDLVLTFLTAPTDLSSWRKQATYDTSDEFTDRKISVEFRKMWQKDISQQWNKATSSIDQSIEIWSRICILVERHSKKLNQIAHEDSIFNSLIKDFTNFAPKLYPIQQSDTILDINNHFSIISTHLEKKNEITLQTIKDFSDQLIPKFKIYTDVLLSLRGLFERYRIMATNTIPQLQRHVQLNLEKLESMKGKPEVSGTEYDKIKASIKRDRKSIGEQLNRTWLIRECILQEFTIFQETQFMITRAFQEWMKLNSTYNGLILNEWEKLGNQTIDMPSSRK